MRHLKNAVALASFFDASSNVRFSGRIRRQRQPAAHGRVQSIRERRAQAFHAAAFENSRWRVSSITGGAFPTLRASDRATATVGSGDVLEIVELMS